MADTSGLLPHGYCFLWQPGLLWLHVVSDAVIALAYFCIPPALFWLMLRRRRDAPFNWVVGMFSAFIMLCGTTHILSIVVLWHPIYLLEGYVKAATALVSIATALSLIPVLPSLLRLPSPLIDQLTGLPSRTLFNERLERVIARARRYGGYFAVLFVDLDGFKAINDNLGHAAGDALLVEIGKRLSRMVREADTVARFGGDEFVVLLERVAGPNQAKVAARRLLDALCAPCRIEGRTVDVSASIGIVLSTGTADPAEILGSADRAMYEAKSRRHGTFQLVETSLEGASLEI